MLLALLLHPYASTVPAAVFGGVREHERRSLVGELRRLARSSRDRSARRLAHVPTQSQE